MPTPSRTSRSIGATTCSSAKAPSRPVVAPVAGRAARTPAARRRSCAAAGRSRRGRSTRRAGRRSRGGARWRPAPWPPSPRARGEGGLAGAGGAVDADQPSGTQRGGAAIGQVEHGPRPPGGCSRGQKPVHSRGRSAPCRRTGRRPAGGRCGVLEQLARLGVPEPHQVADPQQRGGVTGQGGLYLAGALEPGELEAGGCPRASAAGRRRRARRRPGRRRARSPSAARDGVRRGGRRRLPAAA